MGVSVLSLHSMTYLQASEFKSKIYRLPYKLHGICKFTAVVRFVCVMYFCVYIPSINTVILLIYEGTRNRYLCLYIDPCLHWRAPFSSKSINMLLLPFP